MTARYALVGQPIEHSPSPAMHNAGFAALGLDASYELCPTAPAGVPALIGELRAGRLSGVNVTTPLKTVVAPLVRLGGAALRAGAVNTVYRDADELAGALTDVEGVAEPLRARGVFRGEALILGAGGAARAAVLALEELDMTVHVAARRPAEASRLLAELAPLRSGRALDLADAAGLRAVMPQLDVIVQATPAGRSGEAALPLPWPLRQAGLVAFEMLYRPRRTPFVADARAAGAAVVEGWEMLLAQGARSFEIWTGQPAPRDAMRLALEHHLAGSA